MITKQSRIVNSSNKSCNLQVTAAVTRLIAMATMSR